MISINILTLFDYPNFIHQLDLKRFGEKYSFYENSELDIVWDLLVVYEGINIERLIKVKKGGLLFISGEPPMSRVYTKAFLEQFDYIISSHPNLKHANNILSQQALNWHFGFDLREKSYKYNYEQLVTLPKPIKSRNISIISSSKRMMPGHNKRMRLIKDLMKEFPGDIDCFGKGIKPINDKSDAILPYKFHICIENSFIPNYWTEKFADPILGYSVPIYSGCTNITKYFSEICYYNIDISDLGGSCALISNILKDPDKYYRSKIEYLKSARKKLLNRYNLFPVLVNHIRYRCNIGSETREILLKPVNSFKLYDVLLYKLRIKRYLYKIAF